MPTTEPVPALPADPNASLGALQQPEQQPELHAEPPAEPQPEPQPEPADEPAAVETSTVEASPVTAAAPEPAPEADAQGLTEPAPAAAPKPAELSPAAVAEKLKQLAPALFTGGAKPLKLRIQVDIQERAPGVFSKQALSAFFRRYTGSTSYLLAVAKGAHRFDLDGKPAGDITDEHRKVANEELARRRDNQQTRRDLEEQQRRNRAGLLHDYERTTLTRANFCVLKGVADEELDGLLVIAREEAAQPRGPAPHKHHHHHNHHHNRGGEARGERDARGPAGPRRDGPPRRPGPPGAGRDGRR